MNIGIVIRTIKEHKISRLLIVLAIVLTPRFLLFKIHYPLRLGTKKPAEGLLCISSHMAILLVGFCIILHFQSWHKCSCCKISCIIERRFIKRFYHLKCSGVNKPRQALATLFITRP